LSGASFGAQIGGSNTRTITLLNTAQAVRSFTNPGRLAWNARAAGTAGQDAVQEQEGGLLADQDVTIYSATTGLFGGATFGGSQLSINDQMLRNAYGPNVFIRDIIEGKVKAPDYAARLINLLNGKR
jgi:lipid-binding SYLF domain-containing protein